MEVPSPREYTLELPKSWSLLNTQWLLPLAAPGEEPTLTRDTDRLLEEQGWEYLYHRRWYRRLCHFYKLRNTQSPGYLFQHISSERIINYSIRNPDVLKLFPYVFSKLYQKWNLLDISIRNSPALSQFKHNLIQIIRPPKRSTFGIHDVEGLKFLTRLRVKFSDLREHRLRHNFRCNSTNCFCGEGTEDNEHCHRYGLRTTNTFSCTATPIWDS